MLEILQDANFQWVLFGTIILGITSGMIGCFAVLKRQSLISDAVAHAALPGVCLAFIIVGNKMLLVLLLGALVSGYIATYCIQYIVDHSKIKEDTSIGIVLSVFFGFGIVLLTYISNHLGGNQSGLDEFIFGQAAALSRQDVQLIAIVSIVLITITLLFYKEFKLITFDANFAKAIGIPYQKINSLLMVLIVTAIVIGIQTVGVVLMTAMVIIPPAAARFWTERLSVMLMLAGTFGGVASMFGTYISTLALRIPTGPVIVLCEAVIFLLSFFLAPKRGIVSKKWTFHKVKKTHHQERNNRKHKVIGS
ncbi:metal ABC transporter permease [Halalkalibacillus halophilus]|uniref:metal ABC transporter permease n=1 Tax=Halalkalibacillus halophilus TaxID=392827 RepID=UPI00041A8082|nr:metal ABC transporter permease [Halalkalibacillus halophilus]